MKEIADILLVAGAMGSGIYCFILSRRLKKFNDLEKGVGGAVSVLASQVSDLKETLEVAKTTSRTSMERLSDLTIEAEAVSKQMELMLASTIDLPKAKNRKKTGEIKGGAYTSPTESNETSKEPAGLMFFRHERVSAVGEESR